MRVEVGVLISPRLFLPELIENCRGWKKIKGRKGLNVKLRDFYLCGRKFSSSSVLSIFVISSYPSNFET